MRIEDFVAKLSKARQTGAHRWTACCPAHEDKNPSLAVAKGDDGRILIHCFAECSIADIAGAVGITVSDLMPERLPEQRYRPIRRPWPAADVMDCLSTEYRIVWLAMKDQKAGREISPKNEKRIDEAFARIEQAMYGR